MFSEKTHFWSIWACLGPPRNSKNRLKTVKKLRPSRIQRLWDAPFLRCRLKIAPGCHFSQFLYQNCCREWSLFAPKSQPATSESTPVPTPTPSSEIVAIKTKVPQNREKVTGLLCTAVVGHSFLGSLTENSNGVFCVSTIQILSGPAGCAQRLKIHSAHYIIHI